MCAICKRIEKSNSHNFLAFVHDQAESLHTLMIGYTTDPIVAALTRFHDANALGFYAFMFVFGSFALPFMALWGGFAILALALSHLHVIVYVTVIATTFLPRLISVGNSFFLKWDYLPSLRISKRSFA